MARGSGAPTARIGDHAGEGGGGRGQRRAEIDLIVLHPAPSGEVAIEGAQAPPARGGNVADTRAGAAGGLGYRGARHEQIGEEAFPRHDLEDPAAPREDHQVHARRDALALDGLAHRPHVFPGGIGAGADHDLLQRGPRRFPHRHDLVGGRGEGDERLEAREIELDLVVVLRVRIGGERCPLAFPAEEGEIAPRRLVGREHARGQGQLCPHVADGRALRQRQRGRARAPVLEDLSTPAAHRVASQQLEDDVLGVHPGTELSGEPDADDLGHGEVIGPAAHGHRHVEPARPDGEHARGAAERGVAVRAEDELPRPAEGLEVHLVADAVAGLGEPRPVARGGRLHVPVVVGVARVRLVDVVVDVAHHPRGLDPREAHGLELQPRHVAVGVREQALVNAQADLLSGCGLAGHQMRVDELARDGEAHRYRCSTGTNFLPVGPL